MTSGRSAAAVLAAGAGSRYLGSTSKLLADLHGRPLVTWSIESALRAGFDDVAVVTGAVDLDGLCPKQAKILHNPDWASGQASSLQVAVRWAMRLDVEALVVGLGDQPLVPPGAWAAVAAATASIVTAVLGGRRCPPVRLARAVWGLLPTEGDAGARVLMASHPELVVEMPCAGDPTDVDTLEDLAGLARPREAATS